jgi:hypothetical protein
MGTFPLKTSPYKFIHASSPPFIHLHASSTCDLAFFLSSKLQESSAMQTLLFAMQLLCRLSRYATSVQHPFATQILLQVLQNREREAQDPQPGRRVQMYRVITSFVYFMEILSTVRK